MKFLLKIFGNLLSITLICHSPVFAQTSHYNSGVIYTYPTTDSKSVTLQTKIGIRFAEQIKDSALSGFFFVTGARSGNHTGTVKLARDRRTLIFTPYRAFYNDENI